MNELDWFLIIPALVGTIIALYVLAGAAIGVMQLVEWQAPPPWLADVQKDEHESRRMERLAQRYREEARRTTAGPM